MKKFVFFVFLCICVCNTAMAQRALMIQREGGVTDAVALNEIDSLKFSDDGSTMTIMKLDGQEIVLPTSEMRGWSYDEQPTAFTVCYEGTQATVVNPYFAEGVKVGINGADVIVDNSNTDVELTFELMGETSNGSFLYNGSYKTTIVLNGVNITNMNGPAIDIECGKRVALELKKNTINTLVDGAGGDWKAALYCKGHLEIDKAGTLNVTGNTKHAISAKEYIQLKKAEGTINILGAKSDGIHCGQYFLANGYAVNIKGVEGDGVQAEQSGDTPYEGDYADGTMWIQGGSIVVGCSASDVAGLKADADININASKSVPEVEVNMTGAGSKGMKANNVNVEAGVIKINNTGTAFEEGTDVQTAKCISADAAISLVGGTLNLKSTGAGGKCIKCDGTLVIGDKATGEGPVITAETTGAKYSGSGTSGGNTGGTTGGNRPGGNRPGGGGGGFPGESTATGSSAKAIKATGTINIYGGELSVATATEGAEGLESKASINIAGGKNYLKCYDDAINCAGAIVFDGGTTVCVSTGNDAIDSNYGRAGAIVIGNGNVLTYTTRGGAEMGFDCDGNSYIQIKGNGVAISAGGNQGGSSSASLSTASQGYAFVTSSISFQQGRYYTLADNTGKNIATFSLEGNVSSSCAMFTAPGMTKGTTCTLKYSTSAPQDATTAFHGFYLGSTAAGTTNVTNITVK